jgi:hypothetical protein
LRARWLVTDSVSQPLNDLHTVRDSLYRCFERRADALFELADALLTAAGTVPSPVHLSLVPAHRRGWGSLYAALSRGRIEEGPLRELLARHTSAGEATHALVYAVDVSVWSRCDAEAGPGQGYYYHPSRHLAGQPIVDGWAYQLIAGLSFEMEDTLGDGPGVDSVGGVGDYESRKLSDRVSSQSY